MSRPFQELQAVRYPRPLDANVVDTTARWLSDLEDVALGFECAYPELQIERWGHEAQPPSDHPN